MMREYSINDWIRSATKQWIRYDSLRSVTECESSFKAEQVCSQI